MIRRKKQSLAIVLIVWVLLAIACLIVMLLANKEVHAAAHTCGRCKGDGGIASTCEKCGGDRDL